MKTLHDLFQNNSTTEAPSHLLEQVLFRVREEKNKTARREQIAWGGVLLASFAAFVASGIYATKVIASSNFGQYASLIFSDSSAAVTLWKQLILSLAESLPFIELIIFLSSIAIVMWSIRNFSKKSSLFIKHTNAQIA